MIQNIKQKNKKLIVFLLALSFCFNLNAFSKFDIKNRTLSFFAAIWHRFRPVTIDQMETAIRKVDKITKSVVSNGQANQQKIDVINSSIGRLSQQEAERSESDKCLHAAATAARTSLARQLSENSTNIQSLNESVSELQKQSSDVSLLSQENLDHSKSVTSYINQSFEALQNLTMLFLTNTIGRLRDFETKQKESYLQMKTQTEEAFRRASEIKNEADQVHAQTNLLVGQSARLEKMFENVLRQQKANRRREEYNYQLAMKLLETKKSSSQP